jgi:hypothetical protein
LAVPEPDIFLFRGLYKKIDQSERDECQRQDDHKEDDAAQTAILETLPARDFDAIQQPVGDKVEATGDQCVVNDFHVDAPEKFAHAQYIMLSASIERDLMCNFSCDAGGFDTRTLN